MDPPSLLLALFPILHMSENMSCCCASLQSTSASISPATIASAAESYCTLSNLVLHPETSPGSPDSALTCNTDLIASAVIPPSSSLSSSFSTCVQQTSRSITSRLSLAEHSGELVSISLTDSSNTPLTFAAPADADLDFWAASFCDYHDLSPPCSSQLSSAAFAAASPPPSPPAPPLPPPPPLLSFNMSPPLPIYLFTSKDMSREHEIVTTGISAHPSLAFTSDQSLASLLICVVPASPPPGRSWCPFLDAPSNSSRPLVPVAILDFTDRPTLPVDVAPGAGVLSPVHVFKRSVPLRAEGRSLHLPDYARGPNFHPLPLCALPSYLSPPTSLADFLERPFLLSCTLRPSSFSRLWTLAEVSDFVVGRDLPAEKTFLGQVSDGTRSAADERYSEILGLSMVVVTANPPNWEGDHRTWESLASGALVVIDRTSGWAHGWGLKDGVNCAMYDMGDAAELHSVLERFLGRGEQGYVEAREIGERGRQLVVERGRPENRMEDVVMLSW